jgi:hypothetical protein
MVIGKAAAPILLGAASLALRAAWKLLRSRLTQEAARRAASVAVKLQSFLCMPELSGLNPSTIPKMNKRMTW